MYNDKCQTCFDNEADYLIEGRYVCVGCLVESEIENSDITEAEILDEIEEETFKRLAKKFLKLRIERNRFDKTKVILQCDGEVLDSVEIREFL